MYLKKIDFSKINLIFYFLLLITFSSCENDMKDINAFVHQENYPDVSVVNLESIYSSQAHVTAKIISPLVNKYTQGEEPYIEFSEGIEMFFYDEELNITSTLKADYGIYYDRKRLGKAQKNVVLKNAEGTTLTTEELFIDEAEGKIYSEKYVKITEPSGFELEGFNGFISNMNFTVYQFKNIKGKVPKDDWIEKDSIK